MNDSRGVITDLVKGKTVCFITGGRSIEELEKRIEEFKDLPIIWTSMNRFDMMEEYILEKIGKKFDMISDCSTVGFERRHKYEREIRFPKFEEFLTREENNVLLTSHIVIEQAFVELNRGDLPTKYKHKIAIVEEIFDSCQEKPAEFWTPPPNSLTLSLAGIIAGQAKKIIMFGFDGFPYSKEMTTDQILDSYYKPKIIREDRRKAFGDVTSGNLVGDTISFNKRFPNILRVYQSSFKNPVEIVNCSPNSFITAFRKTDYDHVKEEII